MPTSRRLIRVAFTAAVLAGAVVLAGCTAAAPSPADSPPADSPPADDGASSAGTDAGSSSDPGAASAFALADVLARYPDCAAMGSTLGSAIDGLVVTDGTVDADAVQCSWGSGIGDYVNAVTLQIDPNGGAASLSPKDVIASLGFEDLADAAIEAHGGVAWQAAGTGDLRIYATMVEVPGVSVSFSSGALNEDPRLFGAPAVAAAKQLLGIAG